MRKCEVCGIGERRQTTTNEAFFVNDRWVVVERIPVDVCSHCGETTFDAGTAERVRQIVQSGQPPRAAIEADIYEYA